MYTITGTRGTALKIEVTASGFTPWITVSDITGVFYDTAALSPLEFYVSSDRPYNITVTSSPTAPIALGSYTLKVTARTCPVTAISGTLSNRTLAAEDCPDPTDPRSKADAYSFTSTAGERIKITMLWIDDEIDPFLRLIGPSGRLMAEDDNGDIDANPESLNSLIEFFSTQSGTYTIFTSGGLGRYTIQFGRPACGVRAVTAGAAKTKLSPQPILTGSDCHTPLISPDITVYGPERNTNADLFGVALTAGDVFSATVDASVDPEGYMDPHLWLLAPDGTAVAENDDDDQIATTAGSTGTYTLVVGANTRDSTESFAGSWEPDPDVAYDVYVQRCAATTVAVGSPLAGTFTTSDCEAFGSIKTKSYKFTTATPQFVTITLDAVSGFAGPRLTLIGADGYRVQSIVDPFGVSAAGARVSRMVPAGTHYLEISADSPQALPANFSLLVQSCPTQTLAAGVTAGVLSDDDCLLAGGTALDVYAISGPTGTAASLLLPDDMCATVSLTGGATVPQDHCTAGYLALPLAEAGTAAVMITGLSPSQRGPYEVTYQNCPLTNIGVANATGELSDTDCADASGAHSDFYLVRGPADLLMAAYEVAGEASADFDFRMSTLDLLQPSESAGSAAAISELPGDQILYPGSPPCQAGAGNSPCLGFLLQIIDDGSLGTYQLNFDPLPTKADNLPPP